MKRNVLYILLFAVLLSACSNEEMFERGSNVQILKASVESELNDSRAGMESDGKFFWQESDQIGALMSNGRVLPMTLKEGDGGKSSGDFIINTSLSFGNYAVYPYSSCKSLLSDGSLTIDFPASDDYGSVIGEKENSFNIAMWGKIVNGNTSFKHLGGVFKIYVHNLPIGENMKFVFKATGKKITGTFEADLTDSEPILETSDVQLGEGDEIVITFDNATDDATGVFYIPAPVGTYPIIDVVLKKADGTEFAWGYWTNQEVVRRAQKKGTIGKKIVTGEGEGENVVEVPSVENITDQILATDKKDLAIKVTGEVTGTNNAITIPATLQAETTTFTFNNIAKDAKITITEETINSYVGQIIIEVPEGTENSQIEAYVPNGEVYIKQGNVTNLLVSSKNETTIIGTGVEVGTLTVKKGNVRIENGGSVTAINRSEDNGNEVTYVIYEAATAPTISLDKNVILVSAGEWDLRKAVAEGGEVKLTSDFALSTPLAIGSEMVLDLNGYTLSYTSATAGDAMITNNGTLTIKDTSAEADGKITYSYTGEADTSYGKGNYTIFNNGTLSLENGVVENTTATMSHASYAINTGAGAALTINGGKVLNLNGHSVRMASFGLDLNQMTVNGGYIEGTRAIQMQLPGSSSLSAPEMNLTIAGGELKSNEETYNLAVYVFSNGQSGENVSVTVKNGVINGNIAINGVATPGMKDGAVSVSGGTINGEYGVFSYADDEVAYGKISITGGTFKSNYSENYAAPGYAFVEDGNVYYVVYDASKAVVTSLDQLDTALKNEGIATIQLGADLTISSTLVITRDLTLDGNGKTLTYTGTDRAIDVKKETNGANLTLKNLTIDCTASYCQRGVNYNTNGKLVLDNVTVEGENVTYALNMPGSSSNAQVTINESSLTGCIALNVWGENSTINVTDSHLTSVDKAEHEDYAAVSLNNDGTTIANGTVITITGGTITAKNENGDLSSVVRNSSDTGKITISETTNVTGNTIEPVAVVLYEGYTEFYSCMTLEDAISKALEDATGKASVKVIKDIELDADNTITIPTGKAIVIDLNNHTVAGISDETGANRNMLDVQGTLTIKNGTMTINHTGTNMAWNNSTNVFNVTAGGVLNIESATIENLGGSDMAFCVHLNNWGEVTLNASNTNFKSSYVGIRAFNSGNDMNNITLSNCDILTGNGCIWVHNYTVADFGNDNNKAEAAANRLNFNFTNTKIARTNGSKSLIRFGFTNSIYYSNIEMTEVVAGTEAALAWAFAHGKNVILNNDIALTLGITIPAEVEITFDLNGKTLSQEKAQMTTYAMIINKGTLIIKDTATGGKITYKDITVYTANVDYASNTIRNEGTLTLESGIIENISGDDVMDHGYPHAIDVYQGSTTNINGGTVKSANYDCIRMFCNSTTLPTTVNISGGNIINRVTFQNPSSNQAGYGVLNITGGEFTTTDNINANVRLLNFSSDASNMKAKISGGTFDKGVKTQNLGSGKPTLTDWLTIENDAIKEITAE